MCTQAEDEVITQEAGGCGVITLNRPEALNAVNLSMVQKAYEILLRWEKEKKLVIIKGTGGKAFCAGGDIRTMTIKGKKGEDYAKVLFKMEYLLNGLIGTYTIPYVALIDGITMGGGLGKAVHGHYRIATERTICAMPETAIGLFPDVGSSYFFSRLKGKLGIYLALSGYRLRGVDNLFVGFATHYCPSAEVARIEKDIIYTKNPRKVLRPYEKAPEGSQFSLEPHLNRIDKIFSAQTIEGIFERLENDGSDWSKATLDSLKKLCPLSLKITLKQQQLGAELSLQECLRMEYRLAHRMGEGYNFIEGVRALLIDKDQNPKWIPSSIEEVTQKMVDEFFAPLDPENELKPRSGPKCSL